MPACADFKLSILVGSHPIHEYEKDGMYYAESNLFTPFSYMQSVEEIVGGDVEKQAWPVTPYQICIEAAPETPHCFYRVYLDGQKVKSLTVKPGEMSLVKGFRDGTAVKEFLFSLPRFARDDDDRLDSQLCSKIGLIEVECYNAIHRNTRRRERTRSMTFDQANKKDSYKVTKGSLAAWFRSKYPQFVDGVVASSAPVFAEVDFKEYLGVVSQVMGRSSPTCNNRTSEAIQMIFEWWGQPDKREKMFSMYQLCDHINHDSIIEPFAFYNSLAYNFEIIGQYSNVNRVLEGTKENNVTLDTLCNIMIDESRGPPIQRYADVNNLLLKMFSKKCHDFKYEQLIAELKCTKWTDAVAEGARQWLFQSCTEFGWYPSTDWYGHQPFGDFFTMGFNYSCDQCASVFGPAYFCIAETGVEETNLYYGGFNMQLTKAAFPSGTHDPWHALAFNNTKLEDVLPIFIQGTAHCADMYSATYQDPPQLKSAREKINSLIGQWIS